MNRINSLVQKLASTAPKAASPVYTEPAMAILPKVPRIASIVAFVMAAGVALLAVTGPIVVAPMALVPLCAGFGIMRKRVWSAYGFGIYVLSPLLLLPLLLFRARSSPVPGLAASAAVSFFVGTLFLLAGRSLAASGAARGRAFPWILASAVTILPLIFVQAFVIPTGGMEDTLLIGDRILVQRFPQPIPARGDIFVFVYPIDRKQTFVKRIVGIPGDRIKISDKIVYLNGVVLNEPYAVHKLQYKDAYRDNFPSEPNVPVFPQAGEMLVKHVVNGEVVVPTGRYFVLGDNRDQSLDSRYWGFVGSGDLIGKPLLIYDSADQPTDKALSGGAFRRGHTRWYRLFKSL